MTETIASKLQRIIDNVSDALAAVSEKGVSTTGTENSDDLPRLIRSIAAQSEDLSAVLDEQEDKLNTLIETLRGKAAGSGGGVVEDDDLPAGYKRCSYIQFDGKQAVDTGIICTNNTTLKILYTRESTASMYMYGVLSDGHTATVTAYLSSGGAWRFGSKSVSRTITANDGVVHTAIVKSTGIVSAMATSAYSTQSAFETIGTLILGATRNASGSVAAAQFVGKIPLFEMWDGDTQVLKLIPVTDGNGVYRFWDTISKVFHDSIKDVPLTGGNF